MVWRLGVFTASVLQDKSASFPSCGLRVLVKTPMTLGLEFEAGA